MNTKELLMESKRVNLTLSIEDLEAYKDLLPEGTPISTGITDLFCDFLESQKQGYKAKSRIKQGRDKGGKFIPRNG